MEAVRLAMVVWRDAFHNPEMVLIEDAKSTHPTGLTMVTTGFLVDDAEPDSILIAKDWVPMWMTVRNTTRIRKCDIVRMFVADVVAMPSAEDMGLFPISDSSFGVLQQYEGWQC